MNEGSLKYWGISVTLGILTGILMFFWIPLLTQKRPVRELRQYLNPIFLTDSHPLESPRASNKQQYAPMENLPAKLPSLSISTQQSMEVEQPNVDLTPPLFEPEVNPELNTDVKIVPPQLTKVKVQPTKEKEISPSVAQPSADQSSTASNNSGGSPSIGKSEFQLGEVDQAPKILSKAEPSYPYTARRRKIAGKVIVRFLVDPKGKVQKPRIIEANPEGVFEDSVLAAIRKWRFKPGYFKGKAVATWVVLPVHFKLTS